MMMSDASKTGHGHAAGSPSAIAATMSATMSATMPSAMASPVAGTVARRAPSIRRTSHVDVVLHDGGLTLHGAARDLATTTAGARVVGEATSVTEIDPAGRLVSLTVHPDAGPVTALVGLPVAAGFRDAARRSFPDEFAAGTPLALLLDDHPVAALIAGYARLYRGDLPADAGQAGMMKSDICSGWRSSGTMMVSVRAGRGVPTPVGPAAPPERHDDPLAWHPVGPLPAGAMRRRRLVDVHDAGDAWEVTAMFRDTHVDPTGAETVLHEYALTAAVDPATATFTACAAVPRVLPWVECPVAAASADRLAGVAVADVRDVVRSSFRGTSTCTHLNDLLRSLGDVGSLAAHLAALPG